MTIEPSLMKVHEVEKPDPPEPNAGFAAENEGGIGKIRDPFEFSVLEPDDGTGRRPAKPRVIEERVVPELDLAEVDPCRHLGIGEVHSPYSGLLESQVLTETGLIKRGPSFKDDVVEGHRVQERRGGEAGGPAERRAADTNDASIRLIPSHEDELCEIARLHPFVLIEKHHELKEAREEPLLALPSGLPAMKDAEAVLVDGQHGAPRVELRVGTSSFGRVRTGFVAADVSMTAHVACDATSTTCRLVMGRPPELHSRRKIGSPRPSEGEARTP